MRDRTPFTSGVDVRGMAEGIVTRKPSHVAGYSASCLLRISCSIQLDRLRPSAFAFPRAHSRDAVFSEMLVWVLPGVRWSCLVFLAGLDALAVFLAGMFL